MYVHEFYFHVRGILVWFLDSGRKSLFTIYGDTNIYIFISAGRKQSLFDWAAACYISMWCKVTKSVPSSPLHQVCVVLPHMALTLATSPARGSQHRRALSHRLQHRLHSAARHLIPLYTTWRSSGFCGWQTEWKKGTRGEKRRRQYES